MRYNIENKPFPENLISEIIGDSEIDITEDMVKGMEYLLYNDDRENFKYQLTEKEKCALIERYKNNRSLTAISKELGFSSAYTRRILNKALFKLRYCSPNNGYVHYGYHGFKKVLEAEEIKRKEDLEKSATLPLEEENLSTRATIPVKRNNRTRNNIVNKPFPENLISEIIGDSEIDITEDMVKGMEYLLYNDDRENFKYQLTEKEKCALIEWYKNNRSLTAISKELGFSSAYTGQVLNKALRKLRYCPQIKGYVYYGYHGFTKILEAEEFKKRTEEKIRVTGPLEEEDLSTRAYITLKRAGIVRISDLFNHTIEEFHQIKDIEKYGLEGEIITVMKKRGVKFKCEQEAEACLEAYVCKENV